MGRRLKMSFIESLADSHIVILGGGVTGASLVRFLRTHGATNLYLFDDGESSIEDISPASELPARADLAIVSPGWKPSHPLVEEIRRRQIELIGEVDFAWRVRSEIAPQQKWVAITGTNGKTTTIQMVESIINSSHLAGVACGNVGRSVIDAVSEAHPYDVLALELSSFQIEWMREAQFISVSILNIADDHIDWHGSFDNYANAKMRLLEFTQLAVLGTTDSEVLARSSAWNGRKIFYSFGTPNLGEIGLVENLIIDRAFIADGADAEVVAELGDINPAVPHNVLNAMAASGITLSLGISYTAIKAGLSLFAPDRHRLELIAQERGISWVDDSKATNPHAAMAALGSYLSVIWVAGGLAKGARMDSLIQKMGSRIRAAVLIGQDRELIASALKEFAPEVPIHFVEKQSTPAQLMDDVVLIAQSLARDGDVVLLAPACASMDQFRSYAQRGELFAQSVKKLVKSAS
jgi:UDP-N-acetylmuramoylalanine--D-glutamate ligase